jgi:SAM-dependent methyltransferase
LSPTTDAQSTLTDAQRELRKAEAYENRLKNARGFRRLYRSLEARSVTRALAHAEGDRVLDCPCGTGRLDPLLRTRFPKVLGVDRSKAMLAVYRRGDRARIGALGDAFHLPYADEAFDWVVSHRLLHHLRTDELRVAMLHSMARVASRGVIVYAWLDAPLRRRRFGYKSLSLEHVRRVLTQAGLGLEAVYYAARWFHPKAELVCRKNRDSRGPARPPAGIIGGR